MVTKLDRIDKQIVDLLTEDGRMSCAVIARRIGKISERAVRYRLERMIEEKVFSVSAIVAFIGEPLPRLAGRTMPPRTRPCCQR